MLHYPAIPAPHAKEHRHSTLPGLGQIAPLGGGKTSPPHATAPPPPPPPPPIGESRGLGWVWAGSGRTSHWLRDQVRGHDSVHRHPGEAVSVQPIGAGRGSRHRLVTHHFRDLKGGRLRQEGRQGQPHPLCLFYKGFQDCVGGSLKQRVGPSEPGPALKGVEGHSSVRSGPHQGGSLLGWVLGDLPINSQRALSSVGGNFFS